MANPAKKKSSQKPDSDHPEQAGRSGGADSGQSPEQRRGFLTSCMAGGLGAAVGLAPLGIGAYAALDPLKTPDPKKIPPKWIKVAALADVPADGVPRRFQVIADQWDVWTFTPQQPIGSVYLVRNEGEDAPRAFNTTCPHAGCAIEYRGQEFKCPCHNSTFKVSGEMIQPSPSPRTMDTLNCETRDGEVWVEYKDFYTGKAEKKPKT